MACAAAAALLLSGCSQRGSEGGGDAAAAGCKGQDTTGITKDSIKLGGIYPLSGPASAYGDIGAGVRTYFDYMNAEKGGIDGRKIDYTIRDDGYLPPKAVEESRRLIEQDRVFALFQTLGTPSTTAVREYANQRKVPQVFVATGASKWGTGTKQFPWTIGWQPNYVSEARVYAQYLDENEPKAKVAVLYQNDDFGKDLFSGFTEAIKGTDIEVVAEESYEVTDPTVEPQVNNLAKSGADVFLDITTPKFGSQALAAEAAQTDWDPLHIVNNVSSSPTVLEPVGYDKVQDIVSATFYKDPSDPQWADDPAMKVYKEKMAKYAPKADSNIPYFAFGWSAAESFHKALDQMDCPTREGLMKSVRDLQGEEVGMLLPSVTLNTAKDDGFPIESMQLMRFKGERWQLFGDVIDTRSEYGPVE
ncbi:MAG: ABC transporter substrate-binding protein [Actinomycetes bacterium]